MAQCYLDATALRAWLDSQTNIKPLRQCRQCRQCFTFSHALPDESESVVGKPM